MIAMYMPGGTDSGNTYRSLPDFHPFRRGNVHNHSTRFIHFPPISIHRNSSQPITQPIISRVHKLILILSTHPIDTTHPINTTHIRSLHSHTHSLHCTLVTRNTHTLSMSMSFPRNQLGGRSSSSCGSSSHQWR